MEHGVVTDWDDMERIWGWVYGEGLKALSEEVSPLLDLTSPSRSIRGYMGCCRDEMRSFRSETDWVASGIVYRGAIESTSKSRYRRSNLFRNIQRASFLHQCSSCSQFVGQPVSPEYSPS